MRPLSVIGPLLCTLPVIFVFGRRWTRASRPSAITTPTTPTTPHPWP